MIYPIFTSVSLQVPWRKRNWKPALVYTPAHQSPYSRKYYSSACVSFEWLFFRIAFVFNPPKDPTFTAKKDKP